MALVSSGAGIARMTRQIGADLWRTLRSVVGIVLAVLLVLLWGAVLWVYLPSRGLLPDPDWTDVETSTDRDGRTSGTPAAEAAGSGRGCTHGCRT